MDIGILVVDEDRNVEKSFSSITQKNFLKIINTAKKQNMDCLPYVSLDQDTYFNEKQCISLSEEIRELLNNDDIDLSSLDVISDAVIYASKEPPLFLMFDCQNLLNRSSVDDSSFGVRNVLVILLIIGFIIGIFLLAKLW